MRVQFNADDYSANNVCNMNEMRYGFVDGFNSIDSGFFIHCNSFKLNSMHLGDSVSLAFDAAVSIE